MERKMLQPAQLQNLIVIILECARFNDSAIWICHNESAWAVDSSFTFADERMGNSSTMGTYYCFWLFIYGFLVLIAMITIFNIINSISMSVSARLKQYGAFRAIGVSMGQLSKMIVAEAFTYTIIGGVVGTVLGLFCNKLLFGMLISYRWGDAWTPPLPEVAVILLIVVSSVILAVHGPIKRIRNMSIVDTISAQ